MGLIKLDQINKLEKGEEIFKLKLFNERTKENILFMKAKDKN